MSNLFGSASSAATQSQIQTPFGIYAAGQQRSAANASISGHPPQPAAAGTNVPPAVGGGSGTGRRHRSSEMIKCHFCPKRMPQATVRFLLLFYFFLFYNKFLFNLINRLRQYSSY
jgi:hypothetical protein